MAIIVGAPKGEVSWWEEIVKQAFQDLDHLRRHGDFSDIRGGEKKLRLGVTFGEEEAVMIIFFPRVLAHLLSDAPRDREPRR
jgi:hypothetical protein